MEDIDGKEVRWEVYLSDEDCKECEVETSEQQESLDAFARENKERFDNRVYLYELYRRDGPWKVEREHRFINSVPGDSIRYAAVRYVLKENKKQ